MDKRIPGLVKSGLVGAAIGVAAYLIHGFEYQDGAVLLALTEVSIWLLAVPIVVDLTLSLRYPVPYFDTLLCWAAVYSTVIAVGIGYFHMKHHRRLLWAWIVVFLIVLPMAVELMVRPR